MKSLLLLSQPAQRCIRCSASIKRQISSSSSARNNKQHGPPDHNYNTNSAYNYLVEDRSAQLNAYPTVTARTLRHHITPPRRVKMLARDFIDDALYNPHYGYFSKQAVILSPHGNGFDFTQYYDNAEFQVALTHTYADFEKSVTTSASGAQHEGADAREGEKGGGGGVDGKRQNRVGGPRQVWQTPTEMFKPFYGHAMARYLVTQYKLTSYPYHDLVLYEIGAGNGTLMVDILDFIRETEPEIYEKTRYKVIEISSALAKRQRQSSSGTSGAATLDDGERRQGEGMVVAATHAASSGHAARVEIINKSIFDWDTVVPGPCFFLAMEVFDNFAHDAVRYDLLTGQAYQALIAIDESGDYHELLSPNLDPLVTRYLTKRGQAARMAQLPSNFHTHPSLKLPMPLRRLRSQLPFAPNLTSPEFLPTKLLEFMEILHTKFPQHRLLASDFHALPDAMEGINAPVVQTRYKGTMVPCSTYMVHPGYFDIMFPVRFNLMNRMYSEVANSRSGYFSHVQHRSGLKGRVSSHAEFLRSWGDVESTTTQSGENPMLEFYENASFIVT